VGFSVSQTEPFAASGKGLELVSLAERPEVERRMQAAEEQIYPAFMTQGQANYYEQMGKLVDSIAAYRIAYVAAGTDRVLAGAEAAPIAWDGSDEDLPRGYDDGLERAVAVAKGRAEPTALCAVNLMVTEEARGMRLSVRLMEALRERADGLGPVVAAIRPPGKLQHPRTAIEEYVGWTREDGKPFDPWIRSFLAAGARLGPVSPESLSITGSVAEWTEWTGVDFPSSGEYELPGGLSTLHVNREADICTYVEPSVWVILEKGTD
jgi:GNAT superfamily N-acetyltransferase